jgi:integrase
VGTHTLALRVFFCKTLKRNYPVEEVPYPRAPRRLANILTQEEVSDVSIRPATCFTTDIDRVSMLIYIRHGKRNRDRDVPLSPKLLEALREYWHWMHARRICCRERKTVGEPINRHT